MAVSVSQGKAQAAHLNEGEEQPPGWSKACYKREWSSKQLLYPSREPTCFARV